MPPGKHQVNTVDKQGAVVPDVLLVKLVKDAIVVQVFVPQIAGYGLISFHNRSSARLCHVAIAYVAEVLSHGLAGALHPFIRIRGFVIEEHLAVTDRQRSEEHTSELQSLMSISYAVFCLKKKKNKRQN